jgi:2-keto-4-pentenoate hydratase/2-oxohepta-3-ene-1,7-dioic acid hydratase in catechol pathway
MQIARITSESGPDFAFRPSAQSGWITARRLGLPLPDLTAVIRSFDKVRDLMASAKGPFVHEPASWYAPVVRPGKVLAVGLNYLKHIEEVGKPIPKEPMIFAKYASAITGPYDPIEWPTSFTSELDYECELAVVVGAASRGVDAADALGTVFGYCVANDVSARDIQRRQQQISLSKGMDTFCPLGPWITTADEVPDPQRLEVSTRVNGEYRQASTTAEMLFDVASLIAYLSARTSLEPGDVILTGTPSGVGSGMTPPGYLADRDVVTCEISGLGHIENVVLARQ